MAVRCHGYAGKTWNKSTDHTDNVKSISLKDSMWVWWENNTVPFCLWGASPKRSFTTASALSDRARTSCSSQWSENTYTNTHLAHEAGWCISKACKHHNPTLTAWTLDTRQVCEPVSGSQNWNLVLSSGVVAHLPQRLMCWVFRDAVLLTTFVVIRVSESSSNQSK